MAILEISLIPYIGITGFMTQEEVRRVLEVVSPTSSPHMVGVLASSRTLRGEDNGRLSRYPHPDRIADIFIPDPRVLNVLHFNTKETDLFHELSLAMVAGGQNCHGVQLNLVWPERKHLAEFRKHFPGKQVILQIGTTAAARIADSPESLVQKLQIEYGGLIDRILLDFSGGEGRPLNGAKMFDYVKVLADQGLHERIGIGVAGGLRAGALAELELLRPYFTFLSVDAEGQLRTPPPEDALDIAKACAFRIEACRLLDGQ